MGNPHTAVQSVENDKGSRDDVTGQTGTRHQAHAKIVDPKQL
jgi:hypothetical protein